MGGDEKMEGSETKGAWMGTGLGREDGGERDGRRTGGGEGIDGGERDGRGMGGDGNMEGSDGRRMGGGGLEGRRRGARREAHGWDGAGGGKMERSETRGAWVGTGLGREDGGERDGGAWVGTGRWRGARRGAWVGMEDGGERDRRRMGGDGAERDGRRVGMSASKWLAQVYGRTNRLAGCVQKLCALCSGVFLGALACTGLCIPTKASARISRKHGGRLAVSSLRQCEKVCM